MGRSLSDYASPWGAQEESNNWSDEPEESTAQMLETFEKDKKDEETADYWNKVLWRRYASRMKASGGMVR